MKKTGVLVATLLVGIAVVVLFAVDRMAGGVAEEDGAIGTKKSELSTKAPRQLRGEGGPQGVLSSVEAAARLRKLLQMQSIAEHYFDDIEELAKRLSDDELRALIEEVGLRSVMPLAPWIRCALFAEWGRRDPHAAMAYLSDPTTENAAEGWSARQAWFSIFRGWSEGEPDAALAILNEGKFARGEGAVGTGIPGMMQDPYWRRFAHVTVFRELARRDGLAAWDHLPEKRLMRLASLEGLFQGVQNPADRLALINKWVPEWIEAQNSSDLEGRQSRQELLVGLMAGVALADLDMQLAKDWLGGLEGSPVGSVVPLQMILRIWARQQPERALEYIPTATQDELPSLLNGVLQSRPELVGDAILRIEDSDVRHETLLGAIPQIAYMSRFFPSPGRGTRMQSTVLIRESLTNVIEGGGFSATQQAAMKEILEVDLPPGE